jgi:hypothetical protein
MGVSSDVVSGDLNKLNKKLLHLLVFYAYTSINEMHGSRNKISGKESRQAALRGEI